MAEGRRTLQKFLDAAFVLLVANFLHNVNPKITSVRVDLLDEYIRPPYRKGYSRPFNKDTLKL